jgi:hypothetical protein
MICFTDAAEIIPYHEVYTVAFFSRLFSTMKLLTTQIILDIDPEDIERIESNLGIESKRKKRFYP